MERVIEVTRLWKSYGEVQAVKGIDFEVEKGKRFAFLGPNGAGKSTTIDMICTFLKPDSGRIVVNGHTVGADDRAIRQVIGVVFQDGVLDALLTVEQNLQVRGGFYGLKGARLRQSVRRTAETTGITDLLKRPYGKLSGGQRRRCDIARALIHQPNLLILDEPTTGLDPQTRQHIWQTITTLQQQRGMTILFTTHYMEEAAAADDVVIIDDGSLVAKGTPAEIKDRYTNDKLTLTCTDPGRAAKVIGAAGLSHRRYANLLEVALPSTLSALSLLTACQPYISGFEVVKGTMDDAFIAITGKEIRE